MGSVRTARYLRGIALCALALIPLGWPDGSAGVGGGGRPDRSSHAAFRCSETRGGPCACFSPDTSDEYIRSFMSQLQDVPEGVEKYHKDARWSVTTTDGSVSGTAPITLTYSFVPDNSSNALHATLDSQFGSRSTWQNLIRDIFADWSAKTGVDFVEVTDDGAAWPDSGGAANVRGDVRIVGLDVDGPFNVLAYAYSPNTGDLALDVGEFWADSSDDYRFLRNTVMHELGHSIGLLHVNPRNGTKLMEALLNEGFEGPQDDDIRGANAFYGDALEPNNGLAQAKNLGAFSAGRTVDGLSLTNQADVDFFSMSVTPGTTVVVAATPFGSSYSVGPDPGTPSTINTRAVNPLKVELLNSAGATLLGDGTANAAGQTATTTATTIDDATFLIKVTSTGSTNDVQRYTLAFSEGVPVARTLTLTATTVANVPVTVSPADNNGTVSATTTGTLSFPNGQEVTITAPSPVFTAAFVRWTVEGQEQPFTQRTVSVVMDRNKTASAEYTNTIAVEAGTDQIIADDGSSATLSAQIAGGNPPFSYHWTPETGLNDPFSPTPIAAPSTTTTYTVTVTDAAENSAQDTVRIQVVPRLVANAGADQAVISGRAFTLRGSATGGTPPYRFEWSPEGGNANSQTGTLQTFVNGTTVFTLTVTDAQDQQSTDEMVVSLAGPLTVSAGQSRSVLPETTVVLTAAVSGGLPPYTYAWTPALPGNRLISQSVEVSPSTTTTYSVLVSDSLGQRASGGVTISVVDPLSVAAAASDSEVVAGDSITLTANISGGAAPYSVQWTPAEFVDGPTTSETTAVPSDSTTFTLQVRDAIGQVAEAAVEVRVVSARGATGAAPCGFSGFVGMFGATGLLIGLRFGRRAVLRAHFGCE